MRIAVTSQNFISVTGHAGRAHRFMLFESHGVEPALEVARLDLDKSMAIHSFDSRTAHTLDRVDILITGGAGAGFVRLLAARGVLVVATDEINPLQAVEAFLSGHTKLAIGGCNQNQGDHACTVTHIPSATEVDI